MITYKIRLEMTGGREQYTNMEFTTGDVQAYRLEFDFMDNGKAYDCTGHTLTVKAKRSDGSVVVDSGTVEDGKALYVPANSVFSKPDALELEVALVTADGSYATVKVIHAHVREGFGDGDVTPEDTTPILVSLIAQGEYAKQMGDYAKEQGEWVSEASGAHINDNVRHITAEERAGWNNKVDKTEGKGLSANDYTDEEKAKLAGVQEGAQANVNGYGAVYIDGSFDFGASYPNDSIGFNSGDNVQLVSEWDPVNSSYALKISATDTTYENATVITSGLMSHEDKTKLDGIEAEAQKNVVTSVAGKTGAVVLDKSDVGLPSVKDLEQAGKAEFDAHDGDDVRHITAAERTGWNGKASQTELSNGLALKADKADFDAHNADEERHITPQERARWDASAIVGDASGEKIVLDDIAPQGAIRELEIYGKSEQETSTQGKNLLDTTGIDNTKYGITYARQADGGVKVSGTSTSAWSTSRQIDITKWLTRGKTYTSSMTGGTSGLYLIPLITRKDGTNSNRNPFTYDDTVSSIKVYLQINDSGVTIDRTVYLQVEEGQTVTAYEPYGGTVVNIPYELRGVPNTTGGWLARDYIEVKDGAVKLVRECAEKTYDGTESWQYASDTSNNVNKDLYYSPTTPGGKAIGWWNNKFVISHFKPANNVTANNMPAATNTNMNGFQLGIYYPVGTFSNLEAFKTYVSGLAEGGNPLTILYQLATPTVEDITETETGQALLALTLTAPDAALSNTAESGMAVRYEVDGTIAYKKLASAIVALGGTI